MSEAKAWKRKWVVRCPGNQEVNFPPFFVLKMLLFIINYDKINCYLSTLFVECSNQMFSSISLLPMSQTCFYHQIQRKIHSVDEFNQIYCFCNVCNVKICEMGWAIDHNRFYLFTQHPSCFRIEDVNQCFGVEQLLIRLENTLFFPSPCHCLP